MKRKSDLEKGWENRLNAGAQLSKNGIKISLIHPYFKHLLITEKLDRNTIINRLRDSGTDENMGMDMEIQCNRYSEKKILLIRWFSDWDIYIKNTSDGDILASYKNALFLFLNPPSSDQKGLIRHYNIIPFSDTIKNRRIWIKRTSKGNKNRYVLVNSNGRPVSVNRLARYPIDGEDLNLFTTVPDIWTAFKKIWK